MRIVLSNGIQWEVPESVGEGLIEAGYATLSQEEPVTNTKTK